MWLVEENTNHGLLFFGNACRGGKSFIQFTLDTQGKISGLSIDGILFNKENPK